MTEEEAKTKECCRDRSVDCVASACMAWRWAVFYPDGLSFELAPSVVAASMKATHGRLVGGFCGLAGATC